MSILTVSTINTANGTSDLTLRTGNSIGPAIVFQANGNVVFQGNSTSNVLIVNSSGVSYTGLVVSTATTNTISTNTLTLTGTLTTNNSTGSSGQVLVSNGSVGAPYWASPQTVVPGINVQTFAANGTWTKPAGYSASSRVFMQAWGGGGSGGKNNTTGGNGYGGGGGGYNERWLSLSQMSATETVTVGLGGAAVTGTSAGNPGGTSSVGSLLYAYGGGGGGRYGDPGGGGGGQLSAGGNGNVQGVAGAGSPGKPYILGYIDGVGTGRYQGGQGGVGTEAFFHGGGGGAPGWGSVWGGGGGGDGLGGIGGTSQYGGNGGNGGVGTGGSASNGSVPGGGGGGTYNGASSGAGGNGQVIITIFPA